MKRRGRKDTITRLFHRWHESTLGALRKKSECKLSKERARKERLAAANVAAAAANQSAALAKARQTHRRKAVTGMVSSSVSRLRFDCAKEKLEALHTAKLGGVCRCLLTQKACENRKEVAIKSASLQQCWLRLNSLITARCTNLLPFLSESERQSAFSGDDSKGIISRLPPETLALRWAAYNATGGATTFTDFGTDFKDTKTIWAILVKLRLISSENWEKQKEAEKKMESRHQKCRALFDKLCSLGLNEGRILTVSDMAWGPGFPQKTCIV